LGKVDVFGQVIGRVCVHQVGADQLTDGMRSDGNG